MLERFTRPARTVVVAAEGEARALGSPAVEAEHLLLALTLAPATGSLLGAAGLPHDALRDALASEVERSLEAVGVSLAGFDAPALAPTAARLRFGTSAKRALEATMKAAVARGDRRLEAPHLLLGVLAAERGTVPRTLAAAGVERAALADSAHTALDRRS